MGKPMSSRIFNLPGLVVILMGCLALTKTTSAEQSMGIAAVVNDEIISIYDFNIRLSAVLSLSRLPNTNENRYRIGPQVLRTLIDERIKLQEARRMKLTPRKEDIDREKNALERKTGIKSGQLYKYFKKRSIDPSAMNNQLESRAAWRLIITRQFSPRLAISDTEVDESMAEIKQNTGKFESLVSEIFLKIENPRKESETITFANRLVKKIQRGGDFAVIAQNFSHDPSSIFGGDLGWTLNGKFSAHLNSYIDNLQIGKIAGPIRSEGGVHILLLRNKRISRGLEGLIGQVPKLTLHQLHVHLKKQKNKKNINEIIERTEKIKDCNKFKSIANNIGSELSGELGTLPIDKIAPQLRVLVQNLPIGTASKPYQTQNSLVILMVCERIEPKLNEENLLNIRRLLKNKLRNKYLNLAAKRLFRDLRRSSFVEIRL